jgi:CO/xanthine dehydrogenase FAD-binding subunit
MTTRSYFQPETVEEAIGILAEHGEQADVVAGGTDVVVGDRSGKRPLRNTLVAIHDVYELRGIGERPDGGLHLRALVSHGELEVSPLVRERWTALSDAAALVGSPATRHAGTLGGNLANASPAMEAGSPLLVFDGVVELVSRRGRRDLPLAEFLQGPGETACASDELVIGVALPPLPGGRVGSAYLRLEYRQAMEIAVVGAAVLLALDDADRVSEARLALTAVAPVCLRVHAAEEMLRGAEPNAELFAAAAAEAAAASKPIDDVRASASYRRAMVAVIARRALEQALSRAKGDA